jgi:hypothetical protein
VLLWIYFSIFLTQRTSEKKYFKEEFLMEFWITNQERCEQFNDSRSIKNYNEIWKIRFFSFHPSRYWADEKAIWYHLISEGAT